MENFDCHHTCNSGNGPFLFVEIDYTNSTNKDAVNILEGILLQKCSNSGHMDRPTLRAQCRHKDGVQRHPSVCSRVRKSQASHPFLVGCIVWNIPTDDEKVPLWQFLYLPRYVWYS